jgi:hypothetical protein
MVARFDYPDGFECQGDMESKRVVKIADEAGPQLDPRRWLNMDPGLRLLKKMLGKSLVGMTGFEPATPTSRTPAKPA